MFVDGLARRRPFCFECACHYDRITECSCFDIFVFHTGPFGRQAAGQLDRVHFSGRAGSILKPACSRAGRSRSRRGGLVPRPVPRTGEVLVAVEAVSLNYRDLAMLEGSLSKWTGVQFAGLRDGRRGVARPRYHFCISQRVPRSCD